MTTVAVVSCWGSRTVDCADQWEASAVAHELVRGMYPVTVRRERFLQDVAGQVRSGGHCRVKDAVLDVQVIIR